MSKKKAFNQIAKCIGIPVAIDAWTTRGLALPLQHMLLEALAVAYMRVKDARPQILGELKRRKARYTQWRHLLISYVSETSAPRKYRELYQLLEEKQRSTARTFDHLLEYYVLRTWHNQRTAALRWLHRILKMATTITQLDSLYDICQQRAQEEHEPWCLEIIPALFSKARRMQGPLKAWQAVYTRALGPSWKTVVGEMMWKRVRTFLDYQHLLCIDKDRALKEMVRLAWTVHHWAAVLDHCTDRGTAQRYARQAQRALWALHAGFDDWLDIWVTAHSHAEADPTVEQMAAEELTYCHRYDFTHYLIIFCVHHHDEELRSMAREGMQRTGTLDDWKRGWKSMAFRFFVDPWIGSLILLQNEQIPRLILREKTYP